MVLIILKNTRVLIPAAGKGTRAKLSYPKTLYKVKGKPILLRIFELIKPIDSCPTIIVSPEGEDHIYDFLKQYQLKAYIVVQEDAKGMGNAVLQYQNSPAYKETENLLLLWGDIPFIESKTLLKMIYEHNKNKNIFTFVTKMVDSAYTLVIRDSFGEIVDVKETREEGEKPIRGERDIGLFIFNKSRVFTLLKKNLSNKYGKRSGEHGFLYIIKHLIKEGCKVQGLPIASNKEILSLNRVSDLCE